MSRFSDLFKEPDLVTELLPTPEKVNTPITTKTITSYNNRKNTYEQNQNYPD